MTIRSDMPHQRMVWQKLSAHQKDISQARMSQWFREDPQRFEHFSLDAAGLFLDYSKNLITETTRKLLVDLAQECHLKPAIQELFEGGEVNETEQRPALHTALRNPFHTAPVTVNGKDIRPEIQDTLQRMEKLVWQLETGIHRGFSNQRITDVVSIGIGGSYLGPKVVTEALRPYHRGTLSVHYVANVDGSDIAETLRTLNPATTLFLIQSKSFRTQETLENTTTARHWFLENGGTQASVQRHFIAITANREAATRFGISTDNVFPMWDWVGGRYSLWSAIGLPIALTIGMENFHRLLAGARAMDNHFREAPLDHNMPVILGLLGLWYNNFFDAQSWAVIPYDHFLRALPAHLQQLDMESNGKSVHRSGQPVQVQTGQIVWGGAGVNGQHAYHQLLHQGTKLIPVDFILPLQTHHPVRRHHDILIANCLAQSRALMEGKTEEEARQEMMADGLNASEAARLAPHKAIPGNKPSNLILFEKSTPETIGSLIALYEHKVFVQSVLWDINAFDQWGVELGKQLGQKILPALSEETEPSDLDGSTRALIALARKGRL